MAASTSMLSQLCLQPFAVSGGLADPHNVCKCLQAYLPTEQRSWAIIAAAIVASVVLLWLLFGADVGQKVHLETLVSALQASNCALTLSACSCTLGHMKNPKLIRADRSTSHLSFRPTQPPGHSPTGVTLCTWALPDTALLHSLLTSWPFAVSSRQSIQRIRVQSPGGLMRLA